MVAQKKPPGEVALTDRLGREVRHPVGEGLVMALDVVNGVADIGGMPTHQCHHDGETRIRRTGVTRFGWWHAHRQLPKRATLVTSKGQRRRNRIEKVA